MDAKWAVSSLVGKNKGGIIQSFQILAAFQQLLRCSTTSLRIKMEKTFFLSAQEGDLWSRRQYPPQYPITWQSRFLGMKCQRFC